MDAYVFNAALYCADCATDKTIELCGLNNECACRDCDERRDGYDDSERYPQGPYPNGGGEADCPQHCDSCGLFLENPLTGDGQKYVLDALAAEDEWREGDADHGLSSDATDVWRKFYGDTL